jgi:uncharacterized protein (TIGR03435 family)
VKVEFDAASVRPSGPDEKQSSTFSLDNGNVYFAVGKDDALSPTGGYFSATNTNLLRFIIFAYNLNGTQELALRFNFWSGMSSSVPAWVRTDGFDIRARADGHPTKEQVRAMLRSLLEDRFKLQAHMETRQVPVFALAAIKTSQTGPQLQRHPSTDSCSDTSSTSLATDAASTPKAQAVAAKALPIVCGVIAHLPPSAPGQVRFGGRDVTLAQLANALPTQTGMATLPRPVIDQTGLSGAFDFSLEWMPEYDGTPAQGDESGTTFREALKDQLGLKLESQKGPVEVLVIDHVEHPSEN